MLYYRCKCGYSEAWGSMPPYQCHACPKCGSDLATGPNVHQEPKPHDFSHVTQVATDEGPKPLTRCRYCGCTQAEVEEAQARYLLTSLLPEELAKLPMLTEEQIRESFKIGKAAFERAQQHMRRLGRY